MRIFYLLPFLLLFSCARYVTVSQGCGYSYDYIGFDLEKDSMEITEGRGVVSFELINEDAKVFDIFKKEILIRLEGETDNYTVEFFPYETVFSRQIPEGKYVFRFISKDSTDVVNSNIQQLKVEEGQNRYLKLICSGGTVFADGVCTKKIRRSEWRKMERERKRKMDED